MNRYFKDIVLVAHTPEDVSSLIQYVKDTPNYAATLRVKARNCIVNHHTWSHRVVEILDFFGILLTRKAHTIVSIGTFRRNMPHLAWIPSDHLLSHPDYQFSIRDSLLKLSSLYEIHQFDQGSWLVNSKNVTWLEQFDIIIVVASLFDDLDKNLQQLPLITVSGKNTLQRRACFLVNSSSCDTAYFYRLSLKTNILFFFFPSSGIKMEVYRHLRRPFLITT